jgi:hypothetical protein
MRDSNDQNKLLRRLTLKRHFPLVAGVLACMFFGAFLALGVYVFWQLDDFRVTRTLKEKMMHRKTRAMAEISDGLVRGDLRRVESSAEDMRRIGQTLDWHLSSPLYENNNEIFRDSTHELIEAARQRDHTAAKESALQLERSCIECHALINREKRPIP